VVKGTKLLANIIRFACVREEPLILCNTVVIADEFEEVKDEAKFAINSSNADELIVSAKMEAAAIVAEAKTNAEKCIDEVKEQTEQIKQQAYDEGYQKGREEGVTQGKQSGLDEMQSLIDEAVEKTQRMLTTGEKEAKNMIVMAERQIVEIALAVASRILTYQITENPMVVLPIVKNALEKVCDQEQIVLRVSVDDFETVLQAKQEFQNMVGGEQALTFLADRTIERGNCVIDTSYGMVDARIDTQFDSIRKALQGVLP
jgi:flagellar assembly protein FliH